MTLTSAFNTISFYDINIELRGSGSATSTIGLDEAESGGYGTINKCASPSPTDSRPAAISEWYGYNHYAASTNIDVNGFDYSATSCAAACALSLTCDEILYYNTAQTAVYEDTSCNTAATTGYYARCSGGSHADCYTIGSGGSFGGITACSTTTTTSTTTSTTLACSAFNYAVVTSLTDCQEGNWASTGGQNAGFGNGATLYTNSSTCTGAITDTYIQTNDGTNYQLNGSGVIQTSNNPGC